MIRYFTGVIALLATLAVLPAAADPQQPDAAKLALAEQVLVASGNDARLAAIDKGTGIRPLLIKALSTAQPDAPPASIEAAVDAEITYEHAAIFTKNRELYATRFSTNELSDMLAFYRSPGGKALVAQTADILRDKMAFGQSMADGMIDRMKKTLCAKQACTAQ